MNKEEIGMRIKERRKALGLTQSELASKLPKRNAAPGETLTTQAVSNWERGADEVPEDRHREIADALECAIEDLFGPPDRWVKDEDASRLAFILQVADAPLSAAARTLLHRIALDKRVSKVEEERVVYSGSLRSLAASCRDISIQDAKAAWPEVMNSGFVERVSDAEWHIALVFP